MTAPPSNRPHTRLSNPYFRFFFCARRIALRRDLLPEVWAARDSVLKRSSATSFSQRARRGRQLGKELRHQPRRVTVRQRVVERVRESSHTLCEVGRPRGGEDVRLGAACSSAALFLTLLGSSSLSHATHALAYNLNWYY